VYIGVHIVAGRISSKSQKAKGRVNMVNVVHIVEHHNARILAFSTPSVSPR